MIGEHTDDEMDQALCNLQKKSCGCSGVTGTERRRGAGKVPRPSCPCTPDMQVILGPNTYPRWLQFIKGAASCMILNRDRGLSDPFGEQGRSDTWTQ